MTDTFTLPPELDEFLTTIADDVVAVENASFDDVVDWAAAAYATLLALSAANVEPYLVEAITEVAVHAPMVVSVQAMKILKENSVA